MRHFLRRIALGLAVLSGVLGAGVFPASADVMGETRLFHVNQQYDFAGAAQISATLRAVGSNGYWYVDDRLWGSLSPAQQAAYQASLNALSNEFDATIYPRETSFWGSEATPGVDGDPRVVILLERLISGSGGYFETIHNYSASRAPESNAREMIFVSGESVTTPVAHNYVAHEFQHLISFNQKELLQNTIDDIWLNEARSEYAVTQAGYSVPYAGSGIERRAATFMGAPSDSLVEWPNTSADYAISSVFVEYLVEQYGEELIARSGRVQPSGIAAVAQTLRDMGKTDTFSDAFVHWMLANIINDAASYPQFGYRLSGMQSVRVAPQFAALLQAGVRMANQQQLKDWQPIWMEFRIPDGTISSQTLALDLSGDGSGRYIAGYAVQMADGSWQTNALAPFSGSASIRVPAGGVRRVVLAVTHGQEQQLGTGSVVIRALSVSAVLGAGDALPPVAPPPVSPQPTPDVRIIVASLRDGDLIKRRSSEPEVYVVWGKYKRYLPPGVLELYGFQNRPVIEVDDSILFRYQTSNYIRADGQKKVYAVRPEGSRHWLNITPQQWDASGRDWGAIFTVNDAEVAWYRAGPDITR